jgi:hypothetical protein
MADMAAADTVGVADMVATEAAAFMVVTQVDFTDAVPTSLAVAIGAVTKGTGEPTVAMVAMVAMVDTADMVAIVDTAEKAEMTTTEMPTAFLSAVIT